jgi:hypothetical protein
VHVSAEELLEDTPPTHTNTSVALNAMTEISCPCFPPDVCHSCKDAVDQVVVTLYFGGINIFFDASP